VKGFKGLVFVVHIQGLISFEMTRDVSFWFIRRMWTALVCGWGMNNIAYAY
jgi:hypothetical protein